MYEIVISNHFKKQLKQYVKKDPLLNEYLQVSLLCFKKENSTSIHRGLYKLRVRGFNKGKSGGYRLYIYIIEVEHLLVPIHIYSKNHKDNASFEEIMDHLEIVQTELNL